ncbi:MAG: hypothetical protein O7I42_22560 [Alphaproteobacteria bacterium]|nr:hypothetical protein [Alphaproteobacteria bacterium]
MRSDLTAVFKSIAEEAEIEALEAEGELLASKQLIVLMGQAVRESGNPNIKVAEALALLASKGNAEAQYFLEGLNDPEAVLLRAEIQRAVEWHPQWHSNEEGYYWYSEDCEDDTEEKLLRAYRQSNRG